MSMEYYKKKIIDLRASIAREKEEKILNIPLLSKPDRFLGNH